MRLKGASVGYREAGASSRIHVVHAVLFWGAGDAGALVYVQGQVKLRLASKETRLSQPPFPLYPGWLT